MTGNGTVFHPLNLTLNTEVRSGITVYYLVVQGKSSGNRQKPNPKTEKRRFFENFRWRCPVSTQIIQPNEAQNITKKNFDAANRRGAPANGFFRAL
jgi:hypothetical protein